jgi:hypothetical protein
MLNNPAISQYFSLADPPAKDRRLAFVEEMSRFVKVIDVQPDHLLLRIEEPALHRWRRSSLGLGVYVGRQLVRNFLVDGTESALRVVEDSLEPNICRLDVDIAGAALLEGGGGPSVAVTVYLFDGEDEVRLRARSVGVNGTARPEDKLIYTRSWFPEGGFVDVGLGFRGAIGKLTGGRLRGWVYDGHRDTFDVAVCAYINDRLARYAWPTVRREDVEVFRRPGSSARGRGFLLDLPLGYFERSDATTVAVTVAGRNLALRHSPLMLPPGCRNAEWSQSTKSWVIDDAGLIDGQAEHQRWWQGWT